MITSSGDAQWESIFIDDIYWIPSPGAQENWIPEVSSVSIALTDGTGDIELTYDFFDLNDDADVSLIEWTVNSTEMSAYENLTTIPAANLGYWDVWMANVTAYDGIVFGETVSSNGLLIVPPITPDPNVLIIFSELTPGLAYDEEIEWVDWAGTASVGFLSDGGASEGVSYGVATFQGETTWWGISAVSTPYGDLSTFATGTLHAMIKTTTAAIKIGFNSPGGVDAFVEVRSGDYGFVNDGVWHKVSIPVADCVAVRTDVDLSNVENIFAISGVAGELDTEPVYFDDVYYEMGGTPVITDADIFFDPIEGGLTLDYDYSDPQDDEDQSQIRWYKNDVLVETYNNLTHVNETDFVTGDEWYAEVTSFDGTNTGTPVQSNTVTIGAGYEPEEPEPEQPVIPGFPITALLGITLIAVVFSIRKHKK